LAITTASNSARTCAKLSSSGFHRSSSAPSECMGGRVGQRSSRRQAINPGLVNASAGALDNARFVLLGPSCEEPGAACTWTAPREGNGLPIPCRLLMRRAARATGRPRFSRCRRYICDMRSPKKNLATAKLRNWRVSILRQRAHYLGTVQAPEARHRSRRHRDRHDRRRHRP
jgi:hypothetical protein